MKKLLVGNPLCALEASSESSLSVPALGLTTMSWASGFKMPSLGELKQTVDSSMKAASEGMKDAASSVKELSREMSQQLGLEESRQQEQEQPPAGEKDGGDGQPSAMEKQKASFQSGALRAKELFTTSSREIMTKVSGVFDLDSLQQENEKGVGSARKKRTKDYYEEQDVTYITDRVLIMGYPDAPDRGRTPQSVATLLNDLHGNDYVVWNLSEKQYDDTPFYGQVMDFRFPGYPAPPLAQLFKLCMSMESWLTSDPNNVVVVHCMTGRGRSVTIVSCLLEWMGQASRAGDALLFACRKRRAHVEQALVPTQIRYVQMFHDIIQGKRPHSRPVTIKRVALHGGPQLEEPNFQIFKNGKCLFSSSEPDESSGTTQDAPGDGAHAEASHDEAALLAFAVETAFQGDILLRLRYKEKSSGKFLSLFRYGLHTGYTKSGKLTLRRQNLDGASVDPRCSDEMSVEIALAAAEDALEEEEEFGSSFWDQVSKKKRVLSTKKPSADVTAGSTAQTGKPKACTEMDDQIEFSIFDEEDEPSKEKQDHEMGRQRKSSGSDLHHQLSALDEHLDFETAAVAAADTEDGHQRQQQEEEGEQQQLLAAESAVKARDMEIASSNPPQAPTKFLQQNTDKNDSGDDFDDLLGLDDSDALESSENADPSKEKQSAAAAAAAPSSQDLALEDDFDSELAELEEYLKDM